MPVTLGRIGSTSGSSPSYSPSPSYRAPMPAPSSTAGQWQTHQPTNLPYRWNKGQAPALPGAQPLGSPQATQITGGQDPMSYWNQVAPQLPQGSQWNWGGASLAQGGPLGPDAWTMRVPYQYSQVGGPQQVGSFQDSTEMLRMLYGLGGGGRY